MSHADIEASAGNALLYPYKVGIPSNVIADSTK